MTNTHVAHGYKVGTLVCAALVLAVVAFASSAFADSNAGAGVEVNIGANGGTLVRGAQVTAVSGNDVSAKTSLGASVMNWIVKTDGNTEFSSNKNGASGLANIAVGDIVSFRGSLDQAVSGLTVKAKVVKDWTHKETKKQIKTKVSGIVTSINTTLGSFTVMKGNATTTVQTSSSTKFKEDGDGASFADLFLNAKVKIQGMFNASSSILNASSVEIDEDNDDGWDKDDKHQWRDWIKSKIWLKLGH